MSGRLRRVNEQLKHVLSEGIGELKDPRIGFVTITGVEVAPDLGSASVFVSVLGNERKRDAALAALGRSAGVLQGKINRELRLRRTPQLTFHYDPSVERGVRMTALIDELAPGPETDGPETDEQDGK